jgi:hypothetical protein
MPFHPEQFFSVFLQVVTVKENPEAEQGSDGHEHENHTAPFRTELRVELLPVVKPVSGIRAS